METSQKILPFLTQTEKLGEKVAVHCSGGSGRTGHVLPHGWLVVEDYQNRKLPSLLSGERAKSLVICAVIRGRNPFKAENSMRYLMLPSSS